MKNVHTPLAALAGSLTLFGLGTPTFYLLTDGFSSQKAAILLGVIFGMELFYIFTITLLYDRLITVRTFARGALNGAWLCSLIAFNGVFICGFIFLNTQLDFTAMTGITAASAILLYTVSTCIRGAMAGGVIGWMLGRDQMAV
ncbi:hypothetical protein [Neolewinella persica]|uniref:hypothetical protein n=1 Tax=Neolewinella persica TaxID=70998 RepID=UPI000475ED9A|nr:hypothetical protein [Neolewinella persica]